LESNTYYETVASIEEGTRWIIGKEKQGGYVWPNKVLGINNATSAMGRKKTGNPVGRVSAFSGEKLDWLLSFENDFRTMDRSKFYNDVTKKFLTRYGYDLGFEENVPGDIQDWEPVDRKVGLDREELAKENDFQEGVKTALRKVRC
jgi:hypothetical protein